MDRKMFHTFSRSENQTELQRTSLDGLLKVYKFTLLIFRLTAGMSYRSAVLHHGVLHLMTLGNATREEAALANVIVEMLQTSVSVDVKQSVKKRRRRKGESVNKTGTFTAQRWLKFFQPSS